MFDLFTNVELLIMGSIVGFLVLVVMILVISEIFSRKKDRELLDLENNNIQVDTNIQEEKESVKVEAMEIKAEDLDIKDSEVLTVPLKKENSNSFDDLIIEDLDPVVVKIEPQEMKELDSKEKAQIELLKIENELENNISLEDTITNLEAIEEENAIISYQELLSNTSELEVVTCDSGDEPITISEVFKMFSEETLEEVNIMEELSSVPLSEAYQGNFHETPYLSPITGLEVESLSEIQLENTANLEKLDKEIRKTNEFLNILNELKKNLE